MRVYYFTHVTRRDAGRSTVNRVVRGLARALSRHPTVEFIPVGWNFAHETIAYAEPTFLDTSAAYVEPALAGYGRPGESIEVGMPRGSSDWLLIPEAPQLASRNPHDPPISILEPLAYARKHGLRSAVVFHDILPLTDPNADAIERLTFTIYAQALINADLILPISRWTGDLLHGWFANAGYRLQALPHFATIELPEEIAGWPRRTPDPEKAEQQASITEFTMFGAICPRRNQLMALEAFNRLVRRKPNLPVFLHVVGHTEPALVASIAHQIKSSGGRVHSHGYLPDDKLVRLITRSRATIFVSLAEGYGLPVAESLWLGTPSLCSNVGAIAEIARTGGCLTIDPTDIEAITAGIERLATDEDCRRRLLAQLATRDFRSWADYGSAIVAELSEARKSGASVSPFPMTLAAPTTFAPTSPVIGGHRAMLPSRSSAPALAELPLSKQNLAIIERRFIITPGELSCHPAYTLDGKSSLYNDEVITFDVSRHGGVDEPVLFYGPYITVEPGVYLFTFEGELDGNLRIRLTYNKGTPIKELTSVVFGDPLCVPLTRRLTLFEVVGIKTPALKAMKLQLISVHHLGPTLLDRT
jgi:glycosyltransferase involved in cell wall biosynthesis